MEGLLGGSITFSFLLTFSWELEAGFSLLTTSIFAEKPPDFIIP